MRKDYKKLYVDILPNELKGTEYYSFIDGINERYLGFPFQLGKIRKNNCLCFIDYFPYDYYYKRIKTKEDKEEFIQSQIVGRKQYIDLYNSGNFDYFQDTENITNKVINKNNNIIISHKPALIRGIDFMTDNHKNRYRDYDWIFPLKELEFEGYKFYVPNKYKEYLISIYGENYMNFPRNVHNHISLDALYGD